MAIANAKTYLTARAKQELYALVSQRENAVDMLVKNYTGEAKYNYIQISNRMQIQYFALNPREDSLQSNGKDGWWQNEAYEPNSIAEGVFPMKETKASSDEVSKRYFSSFALKELSKKHTLRYPLVDDFTSIMSPFVGKDMPDSLYAHFISEIQSKLGLKVINGRVPSMELYRHSISSAVIVKVKNTALKLLRKPQVAIASFGGELFLANRTRGNHIFANAEKVTKIYDELFRVSISKSIKKNTKKRKKVKISKELKFASRLFANILMARIQDFGNPEINKNVEKCLSLQFANLINRMEFSSDELKLITILGTNATADLCANLGITRETIIQRMILNGYVYDNIPKDVKEALIFVKEKDYQKYETKIFETAQENETMLLTPGIGKPQDGEAEQPQTENTENITSANNNPENEQQQDELASLPQLEAPKIHGLLPAGRERTIVGMAKAELEEQRQQAEIQKRVQSETGDKINLYQRLYNALNKKLQEENARLAQQAQDLTPPALEAPTIHGLLPEAQLNIQETIVESANEDGQQAQQQAGQEKPKKAFTPKVIAKAIDTQIIRILADKSVRTANLLNAHSYKALGGQATGEKLAQLVNSLLGFYQNSLFSSRKTPEKSKRNSETVYSKARQISALLTAIKQEMAEKVVKAQETMPKQDGERYATYMNRIFREITKTEEYPTGLSVRDYFKIKIDKLTEFYAQGEFTDNLKK